MNKLVLQNWVTNLPLMQQAVLLNCLRGPDGFPKEHPVKPVIRWYRRCILISAFRGIAINNPIDPDGGSYTGPSLGYHQLQVASRFTKKLKIIGGSSEDWYEPMLHVFDLFYERRDEYNLHFYQHFMHGAQIIGYEHPEVAISAWWNFVYKKMVNGLHLNPESSEELNKRLGDNRKDWLARSDPTEHKGVNLGDGS